MIDKGFFKAGHPPTLAAAFFYFDMSFMVWVMLGPLGVQIANDLHLDAGQKGLMVAVPLLAGALLRVVNGILVDRIGPKATGMIGQTIVIAGLLVAWYFGVHSFAQVLALGVVLGVAGSSFAVALPLASRWYPPQYQGIALGIAGAGNSGTVFAALFAPSLALAFGWVNVLGMAVIPLGIAFAVYLIFAKNAPNPPPAKGLVEYLSVLRNGDAWWFMFFYAVTFGGFSGLASSLTIYFNADYGLSPATGLSRKSPTVAPNGRVRMKALQNSSVRDVRPEVRGRDHGQACREDEGTALIAEIVGPGHPVAECRAEGLGEQNCHPVEHLNSR